MSRRSAAQPGRTGAPGAKAGQVHSRVRALRGAIGLTQDELARRCRISRQALIAIEAGRTQPSIGIALRLAEALGQRVDEVFQLGDAGAAVEVELAEPAAGEHGPPAGAPPSRVAMARIRDRWVAHPLRRDDPVAQARAADGMLCATAGQQRAQVELWRPADQVGDNLVVVGCDPALGLLADRIGHRECRAVWLHAPSRAALDMLARGHTHVAGAHLFDESSGEFNVPFVQRMFASERMELVTLASWELGLVSRPDSRAGVRGVEDVVRPDLRFIHREPGAGARALVERLLARAGVGADRIADAPVACGHLAVAQAVAGGSADVGVATRSAALAHGLAFAPLAEERFDVIVPGDLRRDARVCRLIDTLQTSGFRRELSCLGGYQTARSGHAVSA